MKTESTIAAKSASFSEKSGRAKNWIVGALYFLGVHWYDGVCYAISNSFSYPKAFSIMFVFLFFLSAILVPLHYLIKKFFSWDMLGLEEANELKNKKDIPKRQLIKRAMRWSLRKGHWWTFFIGSITVGPPIITPLLRKKGDWKSSMFYLFTGTFVSVAFWVSVWSGVGVVTWKQYVIPAFKYIFE